MNNYVTEVPLKNAYRLLNHGPTVLVSAQHNETANVMAAAWACALDFAPPKVTVVIDKSTYTRGLIEGSGYFALQLPTVKQAQLTHTLGHTSRVDNPNKLEQSGVELFTVEGFHVPLVAGCAAWVICKLIPEAHNQTTYDLYIGEVVSAWADERVFKDGHWLFEQAPDLRTLHYVAGGRFYAIGDAIDVPENQ